MPRVAIVVLLGALSATPCVAEKGASAKPDPALAEKEKKVTVESLAADYLKQMTAVAGAMASFRDHPKDVKAARAAKERLVSAAEALQRIAKTLQTLPSPSQQVRVEITKKIKAQRRANWKRAGNWRKIRDTLSPEVTKIFDEAYFRFEFDSLGTAATFDKYFKPIPLD